MAVDVAGRTRRSAAEAVAVGARIGRVQTLLARAAGLELAVAVVGEREVDLARDRLRGAPLRAVHLGGTHRVGGQPHVDGHVGGIGKHVGGVGGRYVAQRQLDPLPRAVAGELGHVQLASVQVLVADGHAVGRARIGRAPVGARHPLVDVFAARIVAHVHRQRLALDGFAEGRALVGETAQAGALLDGLRLVVRIDLDHEAEGVQLVAVVIGGVARAHGLGDVPARVLVGGPAGFPAMPAGGALRAAVAVERDDALGGGPAARRVVGGRAREVTGPVLFAGEQRAPRRGAGAAVVDRAAGGGARAGVLGHHQRIAARHARQFERRQRRDAAVVG